jgi:hypothetical protein
MLRIAAGRGRSGTTLAGLLPVFCWQGTMLLAGTSPSDYGGVLLARGFDEHVGALLEAVIEAVPDPFDTVELRQLAPPSPLIDCMMPAGWRSVVGSGSALHPCGAARRRRP